MVEAAGSKVQKIIAQYREVVGALEGMFRVAEPRTSFKPWEFDQAGSCYRVNRAFVEENTIGPAKEELIRLRDQRNAEVGGVPSRVSACPYHRESCGCILGNLKPPVCISWVDNRGEWKRRFRVDPFLVAGDRGLALLESIQKGEMVDDRDKVDHYLERVQEITDHVEKFPKLEDISLTNRVRSTVTAVRQAPKQLHTWWKWIRS